MGVGVIAKYEKWLTEEGLLLLEAWARDGLTDEQIAHNMGITRSTLGEWKKKYSDISDTLKKGKEVVDYKVENALLKRALGFTTTEVTKHLISDTGQRSRHKDGISLTDEQWELCKSYFSGRCCYCGTDKEKLTKDHIKPLSKGGKLIMSNVLPCCQSCNSSKKDTEMTLWYKKQKFYDKSNVQKINEYIVFAKKYENITEENKMKLAVTKEITKEIPPDVTAIIYWLKNRLPEKWRDKPTVDNDNGEDKIAAALRGLFGGADKEAKGSS